MRLLRAVVRQIVDTVLEMPEWTRLPLRPFVGHPAGIAVVAAVFLAGYFLLRVYRPEVVRWPLVVAALAWTGFALWEWECMRQQANIRIDLFLICPLLVLLTLAGVLPSLVSLARVAHKQPR